MFDAIGFVKALISAEATILFAMLIVLFFRVYAFERLFVFALIIATGGTAVDRFITAQATNSAATTLDMSPLAAKIDLAAAITVAIGLTMLLFAAGRGIFRSRNGSDRSPD